MKKIALVCLLSLLSIFLNAEENEIDQALKKLERLDQLYLSDVHPDKRKVIKDEITQIRELLRMYQAKMQGKKLEKMDRGFFPPLLQELKNTLLDKKRFFSLCEKNALQQDFTVKQVVKILALLDNNTDKLKALKLLFPAVVDKDNKHEFYNVISSMFLVEDVQKIIGD